MPVGLVNYAVTPSRQVRVQVVVGEGDPGGVAVVLQGAVLWPPADAAGDPFPEDGLALGAGATLRGQRLVIAAVVANSNPQSTGRCSATVALAGGPQPKSTTLLQENVKPDAEVSFPFIVTFT